MSKLDRGPRSTSAAVVVSSEVRSEVADKSSPLLFDNTQVNFNNEDRDSRYTIHDFSLLRIKEVAGILGCKPKDVYNFSYHNGLPVRRVGGRLRVLGEDLKKWLRRLERRRGYD